MCFLLEPSESSRCLPPSILPKSCQIASSEARVLKEFLEYAASSTFPPQGGKSGRSQTVTLNNGFSRGSSPAGYIAHPQVGVAQYRIAIGVVHPEKPGSYIIGLECDGATRRHNLSPRPRPRLGGYQAQSPSQEQAAKSARAIANGRSITPLSFGEPSTLSSIDNILRLGCSGTPRASPPVVSNVRPHRNPRNTLP
jgi:hypothetical protein